LRPGPKILPGHPFDPLVYDIGFPERSVLRLAEEAIGRRLSTKVRKALEEED
jgi:hypothetical protein